MRGKEEILKEARDRFRVSVDATRKNREAAIEDLKFLNGEQWDDRLRKEREAEGLPCITINRMPVFLAQVVNDLRMNRPAIKVTAADDLADKVTADIMGGMVRHIEYTSMADVAYDNAGEIAAGAGYRGYIRVITRYTSDDAFEQDILIRPVWNSFSVADDPFIQEPDQSDRKFCLITELMRKEEFEAQYPDATGEWSEIEGTIEDWRTDEAVRVAEYWWREEKAATIVLMEDGSVVDEEELKKVDAAASIVGVSVDDQGNPRTRKVRRPCVYWCKMTGSQVLEGPHKWLGKYIPIVHVDPKVVDVEGEKVWYGLVRNAKGSLQLYNYSRSKWAELLALAPKSPWLATAEQIDGYEAEWALSNRRSAAYLPYHHIEGQPMPQRIAPPPIPTGVVEDAQQSIDDLKATTGIFDASLGNQGNEQSGRAINARQAQTDKANFTFMDNLTRGIRCLGKVLVDLIPKIYDTQRVIRVRGEDGNESQVMVNQRVGDAKINDLSMGKYDVVVTAGPSYASQRLEMADAVMELMRTLPPQIVVQYLDLIMGALNFPDAEKWQERAKASLPPGLNGQPVPEPTPDPLTTAKAKLTEAQARKADADADVAELEAVKHSADTAQYAMMQAQGAVVPQPITPAPTGQVG